MVSKSNIRIFFKGSRQYPGLPYRLHRTIYAFDSTTIRLSANSISWAQHRERKAAAKMHNGLNMQSFMPEYLIVKSAKDSDPKTAWELCASLKAGEICVFDRAYVDFKHLNHLHERGVFWVTRTKLTGSKTPVYYPRELRLITAEVEIKKKMTRISFITNNFVWAASTICELYRARWGIEVFFKELKQTLQLVDFMGYNENAVRWQIWTALLGYVLLRLIAWSNRWKHTFGRLFTLIRSSAHSLIALELF